MRLALLSLAVSKRCREKNAFLSVSTSQHGAALGCRPEPSHKGGVTGVIDMVTFLLSIKAVSV